MLVLMRISGFVFTAPFFSYSSIPIRMKAAASFILAIVAIQMVPVVSVSYQGVFGFSIIVLKETAVGMILGFMCNLCFYIINFVGQLIDMELGLSMANMFDPATNVQVTVTGNIYNYFVMLMLVATNMHYYIIRAIFDSFSYFNVGKAVFHTSLKRDYGGFCGKLFFDCGSYCSADFLLYAYYQCCIRCAGKGSTTNEYVCGWNPDQSAGGIDPAADPGADDSQRVGFYFLRNERCDHTGDSWLSAIEDTGR